MINRPIICFYWYVLFVVTAIGFDMPWTAYGANTKRTADLIDKSPKTVYPKGQTPVRVSGKIWRLLRSIPLKSISYAQNVVSVKDRIIAEGFSRWILMDLDGDKISEGTFGRGCLVADAVNGLFYTVNRDDNLQANSLNDGTLVFSVPLAIAEPAEHIFISRQKDTFVILSRILSQDHDAGETEQDYILQSVTLALDSTDSNKNKEGIYMFSSPLTKAFHSLHLHIAQYKETFVIADRNKVLFLTSDLKTVKSIQQRFLPLAMSIDNKGNPNLIAATHSDYIFISFNSAGEKDAEYKLGPPQQYCIFPPLIGFDKRIYFIWGGAITVIDKSGKRVWKQPLEHTITDVLVTADNHLIVAYGNNIVVFDKIGNRNVLFDTAHRNITSSLAFDSRQNLLVATGGELLILSNWKKSGMP